MSCFRTVLGDIPAQKMGLTYTHEHVCCNPYTAKKDPTLALLDLERSTQELKNFYSVGGRTLVEGTTIDYGRRPAALAQASRESGVNLIATTGYYLHDHNPPELAEISVEALAETFVRDLTVGMNGTDIRAGQIKAAVSLRYIHPNEKKVLLAAARAQQITGAPIWIHHGGMLGVEILTILERAGADLSHTVLGHMDRNPDPYEFRRIAQMGSFLSVDNLARITRYPVQTNIDMVRLLLDLGCLDRLLISADFGRYTYYEAYGGGPGLRYILKDFVPRLKEQCGLSEQEIHAIFTDNPQRVYACFPEAHP